jgi:hypothetical protein
MNDILDVIANIMDEHAIMSKMFTVDVVEYFDNPITESSEYSSILEKYSRLTIPIVNPQILTTMPRGSILGRYKDFKGNSGTYVFYPFFSHLHMPVKPGEQVWALNNRQFGFWVSRKPADLIAEDPNFTHNDRGINNKSFVNVKGEAPLARSFNENTRGATSYKDVVENSTSYKTEFQGEVVPRYAPVGPDLSIQGSNNSLIVLGSASTTGQKSTGAGLIDLVVGRGQTQDTKPAATFTNTRAYNETDKATQDQNLNEGDLDFINDLSRIHISMQDDPDQKFGINVGTNLGTGPSIVAKSNKIRIQSREDLKIIAGNVGIIIDGSKITSTNNTGTAATDILIESSLSFQQQLANSLIEIQTAFGALGITLPNTASLITLLSNKQFSSKISRSD